MLAVVIAGDPGIDGLVGDPAARIVWKILLQPAGDLLGRPIAGQALAHVLVGIRAFHLRDQRTLAPACLGLALGGDGGVAGTGLVTAQLAADGALVATEAASDLGLIFALGFEEA